MPARRKTLTDQDWLKVFEFRCRGKRGQRLFPDEQALVDKAYQEDRKRYAALEPDVFDATVPFGSFARYRRKRG